MRKRFQTPHRQKDIKIGKPKKMKVKVERTEDVKKLHKLAAARMMGDKVLKQCSTWESYAANREATRNFASHITTKSKSIQDLLVAVRALYDSCGKSGVKPSDYEAADDLMARTAEKCKEAKLVFANIKRVVGIDAKMNDKPTDLPDEPEKKKPRMAKQSKKAKA